MIKEKIQAVDSYVVDYVGIDLSLGGFAVQADGGDFAGTVKTLTELSNRPLIFLGDAEAIRSGLEALPEGGKPLIGLATSENWQAYADLAKKYEVPLAVTASEVDVMVGLVEKVQGSGNQGCCAYPWPAWFERDPGCQYGDSPYGAEEEFPAPWFSHHEFTR